MNNLASKTEIKLRDIEFRLDDMIKHTDLYSKDEIKAYLTIHKHILKFHDFDAKVLYLVSYLKGKPGRKTTGLSSV